MAVHFPIEFCQTKQVKFFLRSELGSKKFDASVVCQPHTIKFRQRSALLTRRYAMAEGDYKMRRVKGEGYSVPHTICSLFLH